jgi:hypothetical protein
MRSIRLRTCKALKPFAGAQPGYYSKHAKIVFDGSFYI